MIVVAVAAVTRVARGCVHAHAALAHLISEELALVQVCGKDDQRHAPHQRWGGPGCGMGWIRGGECVAAGQDQEREGGRDGDKDPETEGQKVGVGRGKTEKQDER